MYYTHAFINIFDVQFWNIPILKLANLFLNKKTSGVARNVIGVGCIWRGLINM